MRIPIITPWLEKRFKPDPGNWLVQVLGSARGDTKSGVHVNEVSAMRITTVFACVRILSWTLASLPLPVYRRLQPRGKERAHGHPLYSVLHDSPNDEQTSFSWRAVSMAHLCLYGNAYSLIDRGVHGEVKKLWPVPPWQVTVERSGKENILVYKVTMPDGVEKLVPEYLVLHIRGLSTDGVVGLSPIAQARESIGTTMAAEEYGSRFFGQGANVGAIIEYPGKLDDRALQRYKDSIREGYEGISKAHKTMLLEQGLKYHRVGIPPNEAQFLETKKYGKNDIATLFQIPPHMLADLDKATLNNIEELGINFVVHTMRPWLVNWEQELRQKLFVGDGEHYAEFLVDGLLRGNISSRYQAYATGRQWGWLSANDIRELENMNPLPGEAGDIYLQPLNMIQAGQDIYGDDGDSDDGRDIDGDIDDEQGGDGGDRGGARGEDTGDGPCRGAYRSADSRGRITQSYTRVFEDAIRRVLKREEADVMRKAGELYQRNHQAFLDWVEGFYISHQSFVKKNMATPVMALAEAIKRELADELAADNYTLSKELQDEDQRLLQGYLDGYVYRHKRYSERQLRAVIRGAIDKGWDPLVKLQERFDNWQEVRASSVASDEAVRLANMVAREYMGRAGVTRLEWRATGPNVCPFCRQLHGEVVGIEQPFLPRGGVLEHEGARLKAYHNRFHPPIHKNCVCTIAPAR